MSRTTWARPAWPTFPTPIGTATTRLFHIYGSNANRGDLRLHIEGRTDSVGSVAAMNQALSGRRAASVRPYLVERFEVAEARLKAAGLGQTRRVDSNDTPEGRQNNRRVKLVRL